MGSQVAYSGISAKIKAMGSRLLSPAQYEELAGCSSVSDAIAYLKNLPAYTDCLSRFDSANMHREQLERVISSSLQSDFIRLYKFANAKQKQFLSIYLLRFEVALVKECLCTLFSPEKIELDFSIIEDLFYRHTGIELSALNASSNISEFIEKTSDSDIYQVLLDVSEQSNAGLAEYEMALDTFYFTQFWKRIKKFLSKKDFEAISTIYGSQIDMLNFQWIYRAKKYLNFSVGQIYTMVIPINYKLKKSQLAAMMEAESIEALLAVIEESYYGKFVPDDGIFSLEEVYYNLQRTINDKVSRKNPYSAAIINEYLYRKETERNHIISIIEGIRYGMDTNSILANIPHNI